MFVMELNKLSSFIARILPSSMYLNNENQKIGNNLRIWPKIMAFDWKKFQCLKRI